MHTTFDMTEEEWQSHCAIRKHLIERLADEGFKPIDPFPVSIETFANAKGETRTLTWREGAFYVDA